MNDGILFQPSLSDDQPDGIEPDIAGDVIDPANNVAETVKAPVSHPL